MILDDASDPVVRGIEPAGGARPLTNDGRRGSAQRCRAQMRRAAKPEPMLNRVLFTGLCVIYLSAIVLDVLRLRGTL